MWPPANKNGSARKQGDFQLTLSDNKNGVLIEHEKRAALEIRHRRWKGGQTQVRLLPAISTTHGQKRLSIKYRHWKIPETG